MAKQGFEAFLSAGGESMKEGATWKQGLKSSIKPTIGTVLSAMADQIADENPAAAPPPGPPIAQSESVLVGTQGGGGGASVKRRAGRTSYKKSKKRRRTTSYSRSPIIYNY